MISNKFEFPSSSYLFTLLDDVDDLRDVVVGAELRRANVHVDVVLAGTALAPLREEVVRQTLHESEHSYFYSTPTKCRIALLT